MATGLCKKAPITLVLFTCMILGLAQENQEVATDILIIGGGMAGISAASTLNLKRPGKYNITLLEASNRTGGRIHAIPFGSTKLKRFTIEVGANWVHGIGNGKFENELWNISNSMEPKLETSRVPGSTANCSNYGILNITGDPVDASATIHKLKQVWHCVNKLSNTTAVDMSMTEAFSHCGWPRAAAGSIEEILGWEKTSGDSTIGIGNMSLWGTLPDSTYDLFGPDDHLVVDQTERGYARVIDAIRARGGIGDNDPMLHFGERVVELAYTCGGIEATTDTGLRVRAKHAIVTIPLGALQYDAPNLFQPQLTTEQTTAMAAYTSGNFTKIFAQWDTPFWDNNFKSILAAAANCTGNAPCSEQHNLNHIKLIPGSNTLLLCVVDPASQYWEPLSDVEAQVTLVRWLQTLYPHTYVPLPAAFHMTRHGLDPLTRGAYSSWSTRMTPAHWTAAFAPVAATNCSLAPAALQPPTIYFAGEAACNAFNGYAHGAYYSGIKSASLVLRALGDTKNISTHFMCDDRRYTESAAFWAQHNHRTEM